MASSNRRREIRSKKGWMQRNNRNLAPQRKPVDPKTLSLFEGIRQIEVLKNLITPLIRLSIKSPATKLSFLEISTVICKIIFATPVTEMRQVEDCCTLIERYMLHGDAKGKADFIVILGPVFMQKLQERFTYKKRLQDLLEGRQIPLEKKEEWLQRQYEIYGRLLIPTDARSITFLEEMHDKTPSFVYNVLQYLVEQHDDEELQYCFMQTLLKKIIKRYFEGCGDKVFDELMEHFQKVKTLGDERSSVPRIIKMLLQEYWNLNFETEYHAPVVDPFQI